MGGYTIGVQIDAWAEFVIQSALIDGAGIIALPGSASGLESLYKQIDGKPALKDLVAGDASGGIAQRIQSLIHSLQ